MPEDVSTEAKRGNDTKRIALTIPAKVLSQAQDAARKRGISLSAYVSLALTAEVLP